MTSTDGHKNSHSAAFNLNVRLIVLTMFRSSTLFSKIHRAVAGIYYRARKWPQKQSRHYY